MIIYFSSLLYHNYNFIKKGKRGKGGGFVRAVVKNLVSANSYEKTFTSDENVEIAGNVYQR